MDAPDDFNFPFKPYNIQLKFMRSLYQVLSNERIGIFESPTGTGKSLSLICGSLKFLRDYEEHHENELRNSIDEVNQELVNTFGKDGDWINEQYQIIQTRQKLLGYQTQLENINKYKQKIRDIKNKIEEKQKFIISKTENCDEILEQNDDIGDDFILGDIESDSDEEELQDTDESEKYRPVQIFFCSRTHSQLSQIVGEVKSTIYKKDLRSVSLASRQNYCINKSVMKLKNGSLINEQCLELQKSQSKKKKECNENLRKRQRTASKSCPFYKRNIEAMKYLSLSKVMDIEELVKAGIEEKSCPYYASRGAVEDSQLILIPYQILLSKTTREQCGISLKNNIVIIDEAHNLMDTISQIHTSSITLEQLKLSHCQLVKYKMKYVKRFAAKNLLKFNQLIFTTKQLIKFLESNIVSRTLELHEILNEASIFNINLADILKFCDKNRLAQKIYGFAKIFNKQEHEQKLADELKKHSAKQFLLELQAKQNKNAKANEQKVVQHIEETNEEDTFQSNGIRVLLQFLECLTQKYDGGRILLIFDDASKETSLKYLLLDPLNPFECIINECRSIILAGGTMKPTDELTEQLFKHCMHRVEIHSFGHVVPQKSILPVALSHGCNNKEFLFTHANRNNQEMLQGVSMTIRNICSIVPSGVVCFFTSYSALESFIKFITDKKILDSIKVKKEVFIEPRQASKIDTVLEAYGKAIERFKRGPKTGAIIFSVIGGKLSEGMNFADALGRCVIVVGLPYPNKFNSELVEKMKYMEKHLGSSAGAIYYENLCMKAVNQSIGRAIRHIGDYATVLLLDERYHRTNVIEKLPDWIKCNLVKLSSYGKAHIEIAHFFKDK